MSDGGLLPNCPFDADVMLTAQIAAGIDISERADFIAYLEQRRDNAMTIATRWPDFEQEARVQRRQIDLILGDVIAGMHEGAAGVRARLTADAAPGERPIELEHAALLSASIDHVPTAQDAGPIIETQEAAGGI